MFMFQGQRISLCFEALSILKPNALFLLNSFIIGNGVSEQRLQDDEASKANS
jgi:hypothetical protein